MSRCPGRISACAGRASSPAWWTDCTRLFVARGLVDVRVAGGAVQLREGQGVDIATDGTPGPATAWGAPRIARALALVGAG